MRIKSIEEQFSANINAMKIQVERLRQELDLARKGLRAKNSEHWPFFDIASLCLKNISEIEKFYAQDKVHDTPKDLMDEHEMLKRTLFELIYEFGVALDK